MHILQRPVEVAHQRAADAAGGHLADLYAGLLQEAAVDADLAEFVFDQDQLLALKRLCQQLFDKRSLACAQKAGYDVNFCHSKPFFSLPPAAAHILSLISYPIFLKMQVGAG